MRILVISHEYPPIGGGGANACKYLTRGFVEYGDTVTIVTAGFGEFAQEEMFEGVRIIRVNSKRAHREHCSFVEMADYLRKAYPVVKNLQEKEAYDVAMIFFGIPSGPLGVMLKKKYGLPFVIRFGGGDIPGFQDRFKFVYRLLAPFIRGIWKNADGLVANSEGLKQMALSFCDKYPFSVIPNGVDETEYIPLDVCEIDQDARVRILFVSRLIERKGLQYILPQMRQIENLTGRRIHLTVVGDGPYRNHLEDLVKSLAIGEMVSFVGQRNKGEIVPYYQDADIFILPSQKEGMPNVVLEAMGCGLPILMTPCQGSDELIDGNGYAVDINQFSEKLCELVENKELRIRMGRRSRELVESQFRWGATVERYRRMFEDIIKHV